MDTSTPAPAASSGPKPFEDNALVPRKPLTDDARFDVTALVDLVFMMNIYFLVSWLVAASAEVDLPAARHCIAADPDAAVVVTITAGPTPTVYLGEARSGEGLQPDEVEWRLKKAAEDGLKENPPKTFVLVKAEKLVRLRDLVRISAAACSVKGMNKLNLAVVEKE
jgi:biopolymer transport protein ExbD